ncbi:Disease resistance protein RPP2A, partial [Dissostichus eleginoides]
ASPDLVPIPSGQCHLSRALPAALWLHQSTTILLILCLCVNWMSATAYYGGFGSSSYWVQSLLTSNKTAWLFGSSCPLAPPSTAT